MTFAIAMLMDQTFLQFEICVVHRVAGFPSLVQMTVDRRRPPHSFFAAAWASLPSTLYG